MSFGYGRCRAAPHSWSWASVLLVAALALGGCATGVGFREQAGAGGSAGAPSTELITENLIDTERTVAERAARQDLTPLFVPSPPPYTIGRGDILSIVVWDHPELAASGMVTATASMDAALVQPYATPPGFVLDHQGRIQFPLIGMLTLDGLTEGQARAQIGRASCRERVF